MFPCPDYAAENNWYGTIPPEIFGLEHLQYLALPNNCLYGTLPPELGKMKQLKELSLTLNRLSGFIPDEVYNLSTLVRMDFSHQGPTNENKHCDSGAMGNPNLDYQSNGLAGAILEKIWRIQSLKEIALYDNCFSGTIDSEIGNMQQLGES